MVTFAPSQKSGTVVEMVEENHSENLKDVVRIFQSGADCSGVDLWLCTCLVMGHSNCLQDTRFGFMVTVWMGYDCFLFNLE
jgi:hypothetical protein